MVQVKIEYNTEQNVIFLSIFILPSSVYSGTKTEECHKIHQRDYDFRPQ